MPATTRFSSRFVGVVLVGGMLATGAAACGDSKTTTTKDGTAVVSSDKAKDASPVELLGYGFDSVGAGKAETVTFKFGGTEADLDKALESDTEDSDSEKAVLKKVLAGNLTYTVTTTDGSTLAAAAKSHGKTDSAFSAVADSSTLIEFRVIGGDLYLRADVKKIITLAGEDPSITDSVTGELPPQFGFVTNAVNGDWLKVTKADLASVSDLLKKAQAAQPSAAPSASIDPIALTADLKGVLLKDATVTKDGDDATLGTKLVITAQTKAVADDIIAVLKKDLPQYASELSEADTSDVMDRKVTFNAYVKQGVLTRLLVDFGQFDDEDATKPSIPLVLDFKGAAGDGLTAPATSTPIPVAMLLQQYGSLIQQGLGSGLAGALGGGAATSSFSSSGTAVTSS